MRRVFSHPVCALLFGLALRLFFVFRLPSTAGDTPLYESLASNWLQHRIYGIEVDGTLTPLDIRMPGYPAYLALVQLLTHRGAEASRLWVMLGQVLVDLAACLVIAALAARLSGRREGSSRAFTAALWLSALCPFLANYAAVPLTEPFAILLTALALTSFVALVVPQYPTRDFLEWAKFPRRSDFVKNAAFAGLCAGAGTLFRPETPLLLVACVPVVLVAMIRRGQAGKGLRAAALALAGMLLVLLPWTVRNAMTLHELQPLTPQYTTMPGELVPTGFMAWERTWLYRFREVYLVPWKLNDEAIQADDLPARAFDSPQERQHVAAILEQYNSDLKLTAEEDAQFAAIARERTARHPWRTWVTVPLQRVVTLWFTPRIEQMPVSGDVFPLSETWESDRLDLSTTAGFFLLNLFYLAMAVWGVWRMWRASPEARIAVAMLAVFVLLRTAFLTSVETPEPRYVLVCFPVIFAFAAQVFVRRDSTAS